MTEDGRECAKCGTFKQWDCYQNRAKGPYGKASSCKQCMSNGKPKKRPPAKVICYYDNYGKVCAKCGERLPWDQFGRGKGPKETRPYCFECQRAKNRRLEMNSDGRQCMTCKEIKNWSEYPSRKARACNTCKQKRLAKKAKRSIAHRKANPYPKDKQRELSRRSMVAPVEYDVYASRLYELENPRKGFCGLLEVRCATCKQYFYPKRDKVQKRIKSLEGKQNGECRLYCSKKCTSECTVYGMKINFRDKPPINKEVLDPHVRSMVLNRDDRTCQRCGATAEASLMHVHHILPLAEYPMVANDIDNLVTFCKKCHHWAHDQSGCHYGQINRC